MNQADSRKKYSKKIGNKAESLFASLCVKKGCKIIKATAKQDVYEHWDYKVISRNNKITLVDIKSIKDNNPNLIYLELINTKGHDGWLQGKADLIAFHQDDGFALFKRSDLLNWVLQKLGFGSINEIRALYHECHDEQGIFDPFGFSEASHYFTSNKKDAIYKLYSRKPWHGKPRHDVMTKARIQDMMNEIENWTLQCGTTE